MKWREQDLEQSPTPLPFWQMPLEPLPGALALMMWWHANRRLPRNPAPCKIDAKLPAGECSVARRSAKFSSLGERFVDSAPIVVWMGPVVQDVRPGAPPGKSSLAGRLRCVNVSVDFPLFTPSEV